MPPHYEHVRANGIKFRVWSAGEGDKLALCLHGFPEFSHSWRYQMPLLEKLGYRVWAPDLKGFGGSDAPTEVGNYRMDHLVEDVAALVDASGAKSLTLFGHDWGAFIAWNFAIQKKRPLEKLVILNVPHPGPTRKSFRDSKTGRPNWKQL
ncbi:MAG: alpha/beta hydrolase, partial [Bdellovibrionota bacterium]